MKCKLVLLQNLLFIYSILSMLTVAVFHMLCQCISNTISESFHSLLMLPFFNLFSLFFLFQFGIPTEIKACPSNFTSISSHHNVLSYIVVVQHFCSTIFLVCNMYVRTQWKRKRNFFEQPFFFTDWASACCLADNFW